MHDWGQLDDLNKRWESFKCIFTLISGMHAPLMTRRVRSEYTPSVTPALMREMKHRDYLKRRAVASKCETQVTTFKRQRTRVNNLIRSAKRNFCMETIDGNRNNPKEMWKNINIILGRRGRCSKTTSISSIKVNNNIYKSEEEIAENLNTYFSEIGEKLSSNLDEQLFSLVDKNIGGDSNLSDFFRISNRDCYDLRSNNNTLMLPKPNTNAMKQTFEYRGARLWDLNHENN